MRVTLRLPDELHRRLGARARESGASLNQTIVAALHDALSRTERLAGDDEDALEQLRYIRMALGDVVVEFEQSQLPPELDLGDELPDRDAFRESLPRLSPPLSATIVEEREDRF